jgi:type VI secretion system protein ImpA
MSVLDSDLAALLEPLPGEQPCGPEIDYDADFIALERLLLGTPERQYGDTIIPAEEPDFSQVLQLAGQLLGRSRDLRLAIMVMRGLARTRGAAGALQGLHLVRGLLERHGDLLHPQLEIDGERDPLPRANALAVLAASEGLLGDLRELKLPTRLMGVLTLAEMERAAAGREGGSLSRAQLQQLLQDEQINGNPALGQLAELRAGLMELHSSLRDQLGVENAPDLRPVLSLLEACQASSPNTTADEGRPEASDSERSEVGAGGEPGLPALRTRQDAIVLLEAICQFLERHEPANPAPLLIRRARGLIGQDFLSILRELAPDGVAQAEHLAGLRQ